MQHENKNFLKIRRIVNVQKNLIPDFLYSSSYIHVIYRVLLISVQKISALTKTGEYIPTRNFEMRNKFIAFLQTYSFH